MFFGVASVGAVVAVLLAGREPTDWSALAEQRLAERDHDGAVEAADRALAADPEDLESLFVRARASKSLHMAKHALEDIEAAIAKDPTSIRLVTFKASLLQDLGHHDLAIEFLDEAYGRLDRNPSLMVQATSCRLRYFKNLAGLLENRLGRYHPDRVEAPRLVTAHFASTDPDGPTRRALVEVLPGSELQAELGETLDRAWALLREADALLGDIRASGIAAPAAFLNRAEVDLHLGRLLAAKENLQTLVARSLDPNTRRRAYEVLTLVLEKSGAYVAQAKAASEVVSLAGGVDEARLPRIADLFEAEFFAAEAEPSRREETLSRMDAQIARYENRDLRTLAYRGVAALRWQDDPAGAIDRLKQVFDALRYQKTLDPSIAEPRRARRFVLALLEAYLAANRPQRGLDIANTLVGLSPDDSELLVRRARIRRSLGDTEGAANDLLAAMRTSKRDPALFAEWLETASILSDSQGRTPVTHALELADRMRQTKAALRDELDQQKTYADTQKLRQGGDRVARTMAQIGELAGRMANDPIVAWHLAQEFGRAGETVESRNFLFRASTREPEIGAFRFRLGQYRLDLGLFETAAQDFEHILVRDPTDAEAARYAMLAWRLAGRVEKARRVAEAVTVADPVGGGLKVCADALIEAGDGSGALRLLASHADTTDPELMLLFGRAALAAERYPAARRWFEQADEVTEDDADVVAGLLLARALAGERRAFLETLERFANLPRLLPAPLVTEMLDRIEAAGEPLLSSALADRVEGRYSGRFGRRLAERAAIVAFEAGDATLLRRLRDRPDGRDQLSNETVAAAFGLTMRELGPHAAAKFLQSAREFTLERDWAVLPTAAAFALTPYQVQLTTFLGRYERSLGDDGVPADQALLWWLARLRAEKKPTPPPSVDAAARPELDFVRENASMIVDGADRLDEVALRFLLYSFAGRGFEEEAFALARSLASVDPRLTTAARFVAVRTGATEGPAAALPDLLRVQAANPNDRATYLLAGELLVRTSADATLLTNYSRAGIELFPGDLDVRRLAALAALRAGSASTARLLLEEILAERPADALALRLLSQVARTPGHESAGEVVARAIADHDLRDPALRVFLLHRYEGDAAPAEEALEILGRVVAADPTFYGAAAQLVRRLEALERDGDVAALASSLATAVPDDPEAGAAADLLFEIAGVAERRGLDAAAKELVDASLLALPSHLKLRLLRVELVERLAARGAAIGDLRLLCALSPSNPQILFEYGLVLLEERTDLAEVVADLLPRMEELADGDERFLLLKAKDRFRVDDLDAAREALRRAVELAPKERDAWYLLGVCAFLDGDAKEARRALGKVKRGHPFAPRVRHVLKML
ncbi:MAG: tetratricopeptide repeat protein [Planctomycetota bacterium JB042]